MKGSIQVPVVVMLRPWLCCSIEGMVMVCCRSDLYHPFFLVLASLDRMSALVLLLLETCSIFKVSKCSVREVTM